MENLKNIQPVEDFNWDAFEQGETYTEVSKDDLVKTLSLIHIFLAAGIGHCLHRVRGRSLVVRHNIYYWKTEKMVQR